MQPVPALWLESLPDVPAPLSRRAAALPPPTSDAVFDALVDMRIAAIEVPGVSWTVVERVLF